MLPRPNRSGFREPRVIATSSAPRDAEFLLHRTPYIGGSSTDNTAVDSTAEQHFGSVGIGVCFDSASHAAEHRLRAAALRCYVAAPCARLRTVRGGDFDKLPACPGALVAQHLSESSPAGAENASVKARLGADVRARRVRGATRRSRHVLNLQLLDDHPAVVMGVVICELVQGVVTLPADLPVKARHPEPRLLLVLAPLLLSSDDALSARQTTLCSLEVAGIVVPHSVRVRNKRRYATIQRDRWPACRCRVGHYDLAHDHDEPLVAIADDRAGFRCALGRSVHHGVEDANLGKPDVRASDRPDARMRLADTDAIAALAFPARRPGQAAEAALPRLVEFNQELCTDVTRHVGEPWQFGAEIGQFLHLIEGGVVAPFAARPMQTQHALLVRQVPEESQRVFPTQQPSLLFGARVDAVAKRLVNPQGAILPVGHDTNSSRQEPKGKK